MTSALRVGDYVIFRGLRTVGCYPTPLKVVRTQDGQVQLEKHDGWYKSLLLEKVEVHEMGAEDAPATPARTSRS